MQRCNPAAPVSGGGSRKVPSYFVSSAMNQGNGFEVTFKMHNANSTLKKYFL